jgi:chemotaxis protein MotB
MAEEEKKPEDEAAAAPPAEGAPEDPPAEEPKPPVIWKKVEEEGHAGAHGGAWKIALADMMTAMMAFFLLMWLLGATPEEQRIGIAEYFQRIEGIGLGRNRRLERHVRRSLND